MRFLNLHSNFYNIFGIQNYTIICNSPFTGVNGNFSIFECIFFLLTSTNGGAIYCSGVQIKLYIGEAFFKNCSSSNYGGAIYFSCTQGEIALNKICGNYCSSSSNCHFSYKSTLTNGINSANYTSLSYCSPTHIGQKSFTFVKGIQIIKYLNLTFNKSQYHSSIQLGNRAIDSFQYSNIINNSCSSWVCIQIDYVPYIIFYLNIIGNNSPIGFGVICTYKAPGTILENCIIKNNFNTLGFVYTSGDLTFSNNYILHNGISENIIYSTVKYTLNSFIDYSTYNHLLYNCIMNKIKTNTISNINFKNYFIIFIFYINC